MSDRSGEREGTMLGLAGDRLDAEPRYQRERRLHEQIVQGDKAALLECFDRLGSLVYCHARRQTATQAAAEDLTEAVFVSLWRQPEEFDPSYGPVALQLLRRVAATPSVRP